MKKTQMALAAVALVASSAALANGVTISGVMDAGIVNDGKSGISSGLLAPNFLNIGGSEDLGGGMKAGFQTLNRFYTNTGGADASGGFFASWVYLSGDFGSVSVGRALDAAWANGVAKFDVTGGGNMGSAVDAVLQHGLGYTRTQNAVTYVAPSISGLNLAVTYAPQGQSATLSETAGRSEYSAAATYDMGAFSLGYTYSKSTNTGYTLMAGYDAGFAKVNVLQFNSSVSGESTTSKTNGFNAAIPMPGVEALTLTAGYYTSDMTAGNKGIFVDLASTNNPYSIAGDTGSMTSLGAKYALSKRTTLFANYQTVSGNQKLFVGINDSVPGGTKKNASVIGISHSF